MDNIINPQSPPRAQEQSPPKTGGSCGGGGKKKERRKSGRKSETSDDISASPNSNSPLGQKETSVIGDIKPEKKDDQSHSRQESHVLQDKSNVEPLSMKPSEDQTEDKIQKSKEIQKQVQKSTKDKEGNPQSDSPKSKKELAAERRKKQEAQRAAKQERQRKTQGGDARPAKTTEAVDADTKKKKRKEDYPAVATDEKEKGSKETSEISEKEISETMTPDVELFSHLKLNLTYAPLIKFIPILKFSHPDTVKFGLQCSLGLIRGSNARCVGLLTILKRLVKDYITPSDKDLCRDFSELLHEELQFLDKCRRLSVSMENAFRHLRWHVTNVEPNAPESEAKEQLLQVISNYITEKINKADEAICMKALEKIEDGDVIAIFSASSLVLQILVKAKQSGKEFSVIVVDSRPQMEGQKMLLNLVNENINCTYVLISAISYTIQKATKVFLGAHGFLSNGFVMSRVGTSLLCLMAKSYNIPVLVFCESHKFSERVQTDSFVVNELCDPEDLVYLSNRPNLLNNWHSFKSLHLLNLVYDVTPSELVTVVVTELGAIPCSSIPVVLRVQQGSQTPSSTTKISNI